MILMKLLIFQKKTLAETKQIVDEIFFQQNQLGQHLSCESFRQLLLQEVNKVYNNHKEEIVFNLKGKMTFREIMDVILSFF